MGKIRVKTLGIEEVEKEQQKEVRKRKEHKKTAKVPGLKGGQRIAAVGPSEEELTRLESTSNVIATSPISRRDPRNDKKENKEKFKKTTQRYRSKNYIIVAKLVDKTKKYTLSEALELLSKLHLAKFDETVELHINTTQPKISIVTTLPHGTGKKIRIAIADDGIIEKVAKGKINFDVLITEPSMMPKLARVAKFLGPRGLMPNPKNGTITTNPKDLAKKFEGGQVTFKTESKFPIMHLSVGKLSIGTKKLTENIQAALQAIKPENIRKVTLKSTMSPGVKIALDQLVKFD